MEIFKLFGSVLVDSAEAESSISKTGTKAEGLASKLGSGIKTAGKWGAAIAAGAAAAGAGILAVANKSAEAADKVDKMSQKIGISKQGYQEWGYAMGQCGVDVDIMQTGVKKLTDLMDSANSGTASAVGTFDKLGVSIHDSTGALKSQEEMMNEALYALAAMPDSTERAALATDLFGKSATELEPLLNAGVGGISDLIDRSHELGLVMSDEAVNAGVVFGDTLADVKDSLSMVATNIGIKLMPIIQALLDWVIEHMPEIQAVAGQVFDAIGVAIEIVKPLIVALAGAFSSMVKSIQTDGTVLNTICEIIKLIFGGALTFIKDALAVFAALFSGDWDALWTATKNLIGNVCKTIEAIVCKALEAIIGIFRGIRDRIKNAAVEVFTRAKEGFEQTWKNIEEWFYNTIWNIVDTVTGIGSALFNAGRTIFTSLWDGVKDVWNGIKNWVTEKVKWIADKLTFWRKSSNEMDGSKVDGSHAAGLPFVPYDGYVAELHRGEAVVNSTDVNSLLSKLDKALSSGREDGPITIIVQSVLDGKIIGESVTEYQRQKARAFG